MMPLFSPLPIIVYDLPEPAEERESNAPRVIRPSEQANAQVPQRGVVQGESREML